MNLSLNFFVRFIFCSFSLLMLSSCIGENKPEDEIENAVIDGLHYHFAYNGTIDIIDERSWVFTSHTKNSCSYDKREICRKIDINYADRNYKPDRVVNHSFEFQLLSISQNNPPEYIIIFQDWVRIYPDDEDGNRPISTLKIEHNNGKFFLRHYDNSWQWLYPAQIGNPSHLPKNRLNGEIHIEIGVNYHIEFIISDAGQASLIVNDNVISDVEYKTKSESGVHAIQWGMYWNKGYNEEHDPLKQIMIRMDNFNTPK
ncbi:hypothetical protein HII17_15515 [Thalassotalea sp. M1531]|uniref:Polysaccharide lyase family 7 protein n=1 Tax=Thalassotalea algicola TaxID=2716224 RepID=A0A7Y0LEI1_9GAMM|nr:hypothetical protein [Thalassotalea algicola]NMP32966.1 hypothetical protein [Thalassotalea algicola]